jgi:hypothetical protein
MRALCLRRSLCSGATKRFLTMHLLRSRPPAIKRPLPNRCSLLVKRVPQCTTAPLRPRTVFLCKEPATLWRMSSRERKGKSHERYRRGSKSFAASLNVCNMNHSALIARLRRFLLYPCHRQKRMKTSRNHSAQCRVGGERFQCCHNFHRPTQLSVILASGPAIAPPSIGFLRFLPISSPAASRVGQLSGKLDAPKSSRTLDV